MSILRALTLITLSLAPLQAQVPEGWYAVATSKNNPSSANPGLGGVYLVHPRLPGPPVVVSGLGCDLTGDCGSPHRGATGVLLRPSDGALIVGETGPAGETIDLHVIHLQGAAVVSDELVFIGSPSSDGGGVSPRGFLPDGRVLVTAHNVLHQVDITKKALWAIVDLEAGTVKPLSHPILLGVTGSAAAPDMSAVYFSQSPGIWRLPLPAGGEPVLVASLPELVEVHLVDQQGRIVAASLAEVDSRLYFVDPETGAFTVQATDLDLISTVAQEPDTGLLAVGTNDGPPSKVWWLDEAGASHLLSAGPPGGWSNVQGVTVNPALEEYGPSSPGSQAYTWHHLPNPGGLPVLGNGAFSLTIGTDPGAAPGFLFFSFAPDEFTFQGTTALLDPTALFLSLALPPQATVTVPLPIPENPVLVGLAVYVQAFFADPVGLASTNGLRLTLL